MGGRSGGLLDHSFGGSVHRVLRGGRNDLGLRGRTPESGGDWSVTTVSIKGRVVLSTVRAVGWGGRTTVKNRLKVAASRASGVWASVIGTGVVEGAESADGVFGLASWSDVAEAPAVPARGIPVGEVGPLECAGPGEMSDRGSHCGGVPWLY